MDITKVLEISIYYAPVLLFLLFVLWGFLIGLIRGFRKSLILFIQALIAAAVCVIIFYILVNNKNTGVLIYDISSRFVNYNELLETTTEYHSLKDVIVDALLKGQDYGESFALVLEDNAAYLDTLVNLVLRIILFVLLLVVFFILVFIFYIIYLIFYPERRRKAKLNKKEREGEGFGYHKHVFLGGLVGVVRGALVGLVWLSFIGAIFFVVAGGTGEEKAESYPDYTFTDENLNNTYAGYKIVTSYGSKGIFRVLNTVKDKENVPYYLFAANMVFAGKLDDEEAGIHTTVRFTKEIACYTSFVNSTLKLILKYDENGEIKAAMESNNTAELTDLMNTLMENENFQKEYDELIESFDSGVYFINFGLSFVNSIVAHRNELKFTDKLDQQIIDLMDIIFDGEHKITVASLLTEADAKQLMKSVVSVLATQTLIKEDTPDAKKVLLYARSFIPEILKLSIFTDEDRKAQFNPLLEDLYNYLANSATIPLANNESQARLNKAEFNAANAISETNAQSIDWLSELAMLLNSSLDLIEIADNVYDSNMEGIEWIFKIFPEDNTEIKEKNLTHYNNLVNNLGNSKLLDTVLSMTVVRKAVDDMLQSLPGEIKLPSKINYANKYNSNNEIETYGEIYVLLTALREIILSDNAKDIVSTLVSGEYNSTIIKSISQLFTSQTSDGKATLIDLALKSTILDYVISGVLLGFGENESMGFKIIVPSNLCNVDAEDIKTINKDELKTLFSSLIGALDVIGENDSVDFKKIVANVNSLSDSQIIEASVVYLLANKLDGVSLVDIPTIYKEAGTLEALQGDFSTNVWHTKAELNSIVYALDEIFGISHAGEFDLETSLANIAKYIGNLNMTSIKDETKTKLTIVYDSAIIRATLKNFVTTKISSDFIDTGILESNAIIEDIDGVASLKFTEAESIIYSFNELAIIDFDNFDVSSFSDSILNLNAIAATEPAASLSKTKLDVLYSSIIVRHILSKQLDKVLTEDLIVPAVRNSDVIKTNEEIESIKEYRYYQKIEMRYLIDSIRELGISSVSNVEADSIKGEVFNLNNQSDVDSTQTKLHIIYRSKIIDYVLSNQIDTIIPTGFVSKDIIDSSEVKHYDTIDSHDYGYIKEDEIRAIVDALKELNITTIEGIDVSEIKDQVLSFNELSTVGGSITKLHLLYESVIIKYAMAEQLDTAITSALVADEARDSALAKDNDNIKDEDNNIYLYYKEVEVSAIINSLKELQVTDIDDIDINVIEGEVDSFNEDSITDPSISKLDVLYSSIIIKYSLAERFDAVFTGDALNVDNRVLSNSKSNSEITTQYYYAKDKVAEIVDGLGQKGLGVSNLTNVSSVNANTVLSLNEVPEGQTKTKLTVMYESEILRYILSTKLNGAITSNAVLVDDIDAKEQYHDTDIYLYAKNEVAALITALNDLHVGDVENVTAAQITLNASVKADILNSTIIFDTVSKMVFDNTALKSPDASKTTNSTGDVTKIVSDEQMTYLLNVLIDLNVTNISSNIDVTLSATVNENISKSYILRATVSDKVIINNDIMVAKSNIDTAFDSDTVFKDKVIKQQDTLDMLNAISEGLGLNDVNSITSTISLPGKNDINLDSKLNYISASQIIRATITKKINFKINGTDADLYVLAADADVLDNRTGGTNNLLVIKETEMFKLMKGIIVAFGNDTTTATGGDVDLAKLKAMNEDTENPNSLDTFLASNTILLITDKIFDSIMSVNSVKTAYIASGGVYVEVYDAQVFKTTTCNLSTTDYYTVETQKDMISKVS